MSAQLPETVKISRAVLSGVSALVGAPFPMTLGANEIAILLSFYWNITGVMSAGTNIGYLGLWRKTDSNPPVMLTDHTDMFWEVAVQSQFVTESISASWHEHVILPWPLVLVRAPRLVGRGVVIGSLAMYVRLFYIIQEISDEELAKLMVKDHA